MSGKGIVLDTNSVIHLVDGRYPKAALAHLEDNAVHLSFVTEIEVRSYTGHNAAHIAIAMEFLTQSNIHGISEVIKDEAVRLRRTYKLKTPDAIIAATAVVKRMPLMTGDKGLSRLASEIELVFMNHP